MLSVTRPWPRPSITIFLVLQALDVITTFMGLRLGAGESSVFVNRLLHLGPLTGLIVAKMFALLLLLAAFAFQRERLVVFLNFWFAGVVTWNLVIVVMVGRHLTR